MQRALPFEGAVAGTVAARGKAHLGRRPARVRFGPAGG